MKKFLIVIVLVLFSLTVGAQSVVCTSDAYKVLKFDPVEMTFSAVTEIIYDTTVITLTKEDGIKLVKQKTAPTDYFYGIYSLITEYTYYVKPDVSPSNLNTLVCKLMRPGEERILYCVISPANEVPDIRFVFEKGGDVYVTTYRIIRFEEKE